jgi:uncharacterized protein (TIGR01777 family)
MTAPHSIVERRTRLPVPAEEAFAWHERPGAFERLVPPWERVEVLERSGGLADGARTVAQIHAGPIAFRWVAQHRDYVAGRQFADVQLEGPFARWTHLHRIEPETETASTAYDRIEYALPGGAVGGAAAGWPVRRRIRRMLAYRHRLLAADLAAHARFRGHPRLHVAVTGASGLLGSAVIPFLTTGGHRVTRIVRGAPGRGEIGWDPAGGRLDPADLEGVDAVIHLAGENIGTRWTPVRRRRIVQSRLLGTRLLAETIARLRQPPRVLLSASAVGVYGDRGDAVLTETDSAGAPPDFLVTLGREWEAAADPARAAGVRVVHPRFGIVLTPAGGALGRMLPPFRVGAGGPLGSGRQWVSWVAMDDAVGAVHHVLMTESLTGPVNVTAPQPVTSRAFAASLGRALKRPALVPAPAFALRLLFGEMADTALLGSQRVLPSELAASGYHFRYPELPMAFEHLLGVER